MARIFVSTSSFNKDIPEIAELEKLGHTIAYNPYGRRMTEDEIKAALADDVQAVLAGVEPLTENVLRAAKRLRIISRCGVGLENVDMNVAEELNLMIFNTPDAPTQAVAELCVGLILSALRQIPQQDQALRAGGWNRPMGGLLAGRTLGLIGLGRIGNAVAELAKPFDTHVIAYDPYVKHSMKVDILPFEDVIAQADIVSLHTPLTETTHHIINAAVLAQMKKGAFLINTARGELVDEAALQDALQSGHLGGAALDVYAQEPYTGPLKDIKNIILTAHTGSYAAETRLIQERQAAQNLYQALLLMNNRGAANG